MNKPQSKILLIIALILFFLFTTVIFFAYQGRQIFRSRAQSNTDITPVPSKVACPDMPTPYPVPSGCEPVVVSNIDYLKCPTSATSAGTSDRIMIRSFSCSDGFSQEITSCTDPSSCPEQCLDSCSASIQKVNINNTCLARTQANCQASPTKSLCGKTCDFNSDGACYNPADVSILREAIRDCQGVSGQSSTQCSSIKDLTVDKNGIIDLSDMTACASYCSSCQSSSVNPTSGPSFTPVPTTVCNEGLKEIKTDNESCVDTSGSSSGSNTSSGQGGNTDIVPTQAPPKTKIISFICWDGHEEILNTGCLEKADFDRAMQDILENDCTGRKSPECNISPSVYPTPTGRISVIPTQPISGVPTIIISGFPSPTLNISTPSITMSPSVIISQPPISADPAQCPLRSKGDCNCNSKVDLADFECYRVQFLGTQACSSADFNGDKKCDLQDFNIFRVTVTTDE